MAMANLTDQQIIQQFKEDCKIRDLSNHTIENYTSCLNLYTTYLKQHGYTIFTVDREILRELIADLRKKGIHHKTIENRFSAYSSLYDYAVYEQLITQNIIPGLRKRYLQRYKNEIIHHRKLISVEQMAQFIHSILDTRDKAICLLFAKTGIRRRELGALDLDDINWENMSIILKPTHKRSNRTVFFDNETAFTLKQWLVKREHLADNKNNALFTSYTNRRSRFKRNGIGTIFTKWATISGLHKPDSKKLEDHFTPHCCRHWFTTHLRRNGMPREYVEELRGDKRNGAMDIYYPIDSEDLRKNYLSFIPQLGII